MSKKSDLRCKSLIAVLGLVSTFTANSQVSASIEEVADLNRQKVIAELRKQLDASKLDKSPEVSKEANLRALQSQKESIADQPPEVISIFGLRPDALQAVITTPGSRNMRVRTGDITSNGWEVEKIAIGQVMFRKEQKLLPAATHSKKSKTGSSSDEKPTYKRITVGLSPLQRSLSNPLGVSGSPPTPFAGQVSPGIGYSPQAPVMLQLPPVAPLPVSAPISGVR